MNLSELAVGWLNPDANMGGFFIMGVSDWLGVVGCGWGGFACEYDVEPKFRETRLHQVASNSRNMILTFVGERMLGLPRSV